MALGDATCSCAGLCATLRLPVTTIVLELVVSDSGSASVGLVVWAWRAIGIVNTDATNMDFNVRR